METPTAYYFIISSSGSKLYFTACDGKRIAKNKIPSHIVKNVLEDTSKSKFVKIERSKNPDDYYYTMNNIGSKYYVNVHTTKSVPKSDIDPSIIKKIKYLGDPSLLSCSETSDNPNDYFYVEIRTVPGKSYKIIYLKNPRMRVPKAKIPKGIYDKIQCGEESFRSHNNPQDTFLSEDLEKLLIDNNITTKKELMTCY